MKPTWGLVAAMAMMVGSLFALTAAGRVYLSGADSTPRMTEADFEKERQWFRANVPAESDSL